MANAMHRIKNGPKICILFGVLLLYYDTPLSDAAYTIPKKKVVPETFGRPFPVATGLRPAVLQSSYLIRNS